LGNWKINRDERIRNGLSLGYKCFECRCAGRPGRRPAVAGVQLHPRPARKIRRPAGDQEILDHGAGAAGSRRAGDWGELPEPVDLNPLHPHGHPRRHQAVRNRPGDQPVHLQNLAAGSLGQSPQGRPRYGRLQNACAGGVEKFSVVSHQSSVNQRSCNGLLIVIQFLN
jgi:hypothetical protein